MRSRTASRKEQLVNEHNNHANKLTSIALAIQSVYSQHQAYLYGDAKNSGITSTDREQPWLIVTLE